LNPKKKRQKKDVPKTDSPESTRGAAIEELREEVDELRKLVNMYTSPKTGAKRRRVSSNPRAKASSIKHSAPGTSQNVEVKNNADPDIFFASALSPKGSPPALILEYKEHEVREATVSDSHAELFDEARSLWLTGDWDALAGWHLSEFSNSPKRTRIALLVAAALHEVGDYHGSHEFLRLAFAWGANRQDLVKIVIGQAHVALGRANLAKKAFAAAEEHFRACISCIAPNRSAKRYAKDRVFREAAGMGYIPEAANLLASELPSQSRLPVASPSQLDQLETKLAVLQTLSITARQSTPAPDIAGLEIDKSKLQASALAYYHALDDTKDRSTTPFVLIDSKSLPRSGLHFLKDALAKLFGDHFSFCSWYQDAGCCRCMPCALTGFASAAKQTSTFKVRLIKSHDFDLTDPEYASDSHLRRIILIRDPVKVLTSWFALDQLNNYSGELASQGINMPKIWWLHESELTRPAFACLDKHFRAPSAATLQDWLARKEEYCAGFMRKWVLPLVSAPITSTTVVPYANITHYLDSLACEFQPLLEPEQQAHVAAKLPRIKAAFKQRADPFSAPSEKLSLYLRNHADFFTASADRLNGLRSFQFALRQQ
jgi:hypothetical protein